MCIVTVYGTLRKNILVLSKVPNDFKGARSAEWTGRWWEYIITTKLQSLKFNTFNSTEADSHIDILAMKNHTMIPLQVRSASWNDGQYRASLRVGYDNRPWTTMVADVDFIIIGGFRPTHEGPEIFVIPSRVLKGKQNIHFTPDGRYAEYRDAWYQLQHASAGKDSIEFLMSREESLLGWNKAPWMAHKVAVKRRDRAEVSVVVLLVSLKRLYDWARDRDADGNQEFFYLLVQEINRITLHELFHIFHDEIMGTLHDDEEMVKKLSEEMTYG